MTKKKKIYFFVLTFFVLCMVLFIIGEIFFRFFKPQFSPREFYERSLKYDSAAFSRHVIKASKDKVHGKGDHFWEINRFGYRGPEFEWEKPQGTIRLIVYGGSAGFNIRADLGEDWPRQLEKNLHQKGFSQVEVINAGVPGHASFDSFGRFFAEGHLLAPDFVLLYHGWNDIKSLGDGRPLLRKHKPSMRDKDPRLQTLGSLDRLLAENSHFYCYVRDYYFRHKHGFGLEGKGKPKPFYKKIENSSLKQFEITVSLFCDLAREIGATPILVSQIRLPHKNNGEKEKKMIRYIRGRFEHELLIEAFEKLDQILKRVASDKGIPFFDPSEAFNGKKEFFTDHAHLTEEGSSGLAVWLADAMEILLKNDSNSST